MDFFFPASISASVHKQDESATRWLEISLIFYVLLTAVSKYPTG